MATPLLKFGSYTFPFGFRVSVDPASRVIPVQKLPMAHGARSITGYMDAKVITVQGQLYVGPMTLTDYRTRLDALRAALAAGPASLYLWSDRYYRNAQAQDRTNYVATGFGRLGDIDIEFTCPDPFQYAETLDSTTEAVSATGETFAVVTAGNAPSVPVLAITAEGSGAKTIAWTITNQTTGESFTLTGSVTGGDVITVDCLNHAAAIGGTDRMDLFDGQWLTLAVGSNTLEETTGAATISQIIVTRRDRWY
jgi:phage-related protein